MSAPKGLFPAGAARGKVYRTGPLERVVIGGKQIPGEVEVRCAIKVKHDPKKAAGKNSSTPTIHGLDEQDGEIVVRCWTDEQFAAFDEVFGDILPFVGYAPSAYAIDAMALSSIKVKAIIVTGATSWKWATANGGARCLEMTIHFRHWLNDQRPEPVTVNVNKKVRKAPGSVREGAINDSAKTPPSEQQNTFTVVEKSS